MTITPSKQTYQCQDPRENYLLSKDDEITVHKHDIEEIHYRTVRVKHLCSKTWKWIWKPITLKHREDGPAQIRKRMGGKWRRVVVEEKTWYYLGRIHRTDGPALLNADGDKIWYKWGGIHRVGGPAVTRVTGKKVWWENDKVYRRHGPNIIEADGTMRWMNDKSQPHREGGPAVICPNGSEEWRLNGKLHREDGPALVNWNGTEEWYINGEKLNDLEITRLICETYGGKAV